MNSVNNPKPLSKEQERALQALASIKQDCEDLTKFVPQPPNFERERQALSARPNDPVVNHMVVTFDKATAFKPRADTSPYVETRKAKTRRENVQNLMRTKGITNGALAEIMGTKAGFVSHIVGKNPSRPLPDDKARMIEASLHLEMGALDKSDIPQQAPVVGYAATPKHVPALVDIFTSSENMQTMTSALDAVLQETDGMGLSARQLSSITSLVMSDTAEHGGVVRPEYVKRIIAALAPR